MTSLLWNARVRRGDHVHVHETSSCAGLSTAISAVVEAQNKTAPYEIMSSTPSAGSSQAGTNKDELK